MYKFLFLFLLLSFTQTFNSKLLAQQDSCIHLEFETSNGNAGDTVCVRIKVSNFKKIVAFQFPINYDPKVVTPIIKQNFANIVGFDENNVGFDFIRQAVRVSYYNPNDDTVNLNDNSILFEVCFKLIGNPGECSNILFTDRPIVTEFVQRCPPMPDVPICIVNDNPQAKICINAPPNLTVFATSCGTTTATGTITIKAWGGSPSYFVNCPTTVPPTINQRIINPGDCLIINGQTPGVYNFRVSDGTGKDSIFNVIVNNNASINITEDLSYRADPTCWYSLNGRVGINVIGGASPLFVKWEPLNVYGSNRLNGLGPGKYTAVVTDSFGCIATKDFFLISDTLKGELVVDKAVSCKEFCDGKATIKGSGGTPFLGGNYSFVWSMNSKADCPIAKQCTNDSICGDQFVVIRDRNFCELVFRFNIPFNGILSSDVKVDSVRCKGESNGKIYITSKNTAAINLPITFELRDANNNLINGGTTTNENYTSPDLPVGKYYIKTIDALGCTNLDTVDIYEPTALDLLENQISTSESCNPGGDAILDVRGIGGTPTYQYSWSNMVNSGRNNNLIQGTYTVTITDANGCTISRSYTITKPIGPKINGFNNTDVNCQNDLTGCVEVLFTPGSTPVSIKWSIPGNTARICNLGPGNYTVTLTDQSGCIDTATTSILTIANPIVVDSVILNNPSCPGKSDGIIIVFAKGGKGNLNYQWNNSVNSPVNSSLKAGQYIIEIDDIGGCEGLKDTFTLVDRPKPQILVTSLIDPSCAETFSCDGSAAITVRTNDSIVVVYWSSGEKNRYISNSGVFTDTARGLCSGPQYAIITVNDLCNDTIFFNVNVPPRINFDSNRLILVTPSCYGAKDGQITVSAKGGCSPYTYDWINPVSTGPTITNLGDGYYKVKITDCRGCVHFDSVRLRQPDTIRVQVIPGSTYDVSCSGKSDARITVAWNGGSGGAAKFNWTPNVGKDSILTNLSAGNYTVTVTDNNNCTGTATVQISEPQPMMIVLTPIDTPKCKEDQLSFSVTQVLGGLGPQYKFTIENGAPNNIGDVIPLYSGSYKITVYDRNGCSRDTVIVIPDPSGDLSLNFTKDVDTIILGDSVDLIGVINTLSPIVNYLWNPTSSIANLNTSITRASPGNTTEYILTVTDENGCVATDKILIVVESVRHFYTPNVFSPNDDQINDFLEFTVGPDVAGIEKVEVFDRWGGRLYSNSNLLINSNKINTWDGRKNNEYVNPGVYVYQAQVRFKDGSLLIYRGDITVLR